MIRFAVLCSWRAVFVLFPFFAGFSANALKTQVVRFDIEARDGSNQPGSTLPRPQLDEQGIARLAAHCDPDGLQPREVLRTLCLHECREYNAHIFENIFEKRFADRVRRTFSSLNGPAMLTVTDSHAYKFLRNFLEKAQKSAVADGKPLTVVNAALDPQSFGECGNHGSKLSGDLFRVVCLDLYGWLPDVFFNRMSEGMFLMDQEKGSDAEACIYNMLLWTKPVLFRTAVAASPQGVLMIDIDVILYRNLLSYVRTEMPEGSSFVTGSESSGRANTGTVFATNQSLPVLNRWVQGNYAFLKDRYGDQSALQSLLQDDHVLAAAWSKFPQSIVGQCGIKGEYARHYNCFRGNKIRPMQDRGDWYRGNTNKVP